MRFTRFNIIGTSGSGKSTFSRKLAEILSLPYVELDQVFWQPNWKHLSDEELFRQVNKITEKDSWVLDGNYSRTTAIKWARVECVVWLDHSFGVTVYRALKRAINRAATKRELWPGTGNTESFRVSFFSKDSVILWTLQNYYKNKKKYSLAMNDERYRGIKFVRLCSQADANDFISDLNRK